MNVLQLKNVKYTYGRSTPFEKTALDDVSISIEGGKITGIIGHTGSGKSTLVGILVGLIPPDEGQLIYNSQDVWANPKKPQGVKFNIGLVMQYPEYQLFDETVLDDIAYAPRNMNLSEDEIHSRVYESIRYTGISEDLLSKSPFDLSGGQKRRVAIAGVMAMRPKILVLDEPAAGLDPKGRAEILGGLRTYCDQTGTSIVIVSHSMEDIARYCDDIIVMNNGRVELHGSAQCVFENEQLLESFGLKIPNITRICRLLKKQALEIDTTVLTAEDAREKIKACFEDKRRNGRA